MITSYIYIYGNRTLSADLVFLFWRDHYLKVWGNRCVADLTYLVQRGGLCKLRARPIAKTNHGFGIPEFEKVPHICIVVRASHHQNKNNNESF